MNQRCYMYKLKYYTYDIVCISGPTISYWIYIPCEILHPSISYVRNTISYVNMISSKRTMSHLWCCRSDSWILHVRYRMYDLANDIVGVTYDVRLTNLRYRTWPTMSLVTFNIVCSKNPHELEWSRLAALRCGSLFLSCQWQPVTMSCAKQRLPVGVSGWVGGLVVWNFIWFKFEPSRTWNQVDFCANLLICNRYYWFDNALQF
jgi:hypothetical protein